MIILQKLFLHILKHLDAILFQISCFSAALHCIEGMLVMMMMNCPVADVALTILTQGTLQIQIQFLRQRSNPTLEQTNMIFLQKIFFSILMHLDAILSQISCFSSTAALHCIEGMLIMMMMNCPVAVVALIHPS